MGCFGNYRTIKPLSNQDVSVQFYSPDDNAIYKEVSENFKKRVERRDNINLENCKNPSKNSEQPLFVLCVFCTRLLDNVRHALKYVHRKEGVVLLIIHMRKEHDLPKGESQLPEEYTFVSSVIDLVYTSENGFYDCKMNDDGFKKIKNACSVNEKPISVNQSQTQKKNQITKLYKPKNRGLYLKLSDELKRKYDTITWMDCDDPSAELEDQLFVLCIVCTEIYSDAEAVLKHVNEGNAVVLLIIHMREPHDLPNNLEDFDAKQKEATPFVRSIIHLVYTNQKGFYKCIMNHDISEGIEQVIYKETSKDEKTKFCSIS